LKKSNSEVSGKKKSTAKLDNYQIL